MKKIIISTLALVLTMAAQAQTKDSIDCTVFTVGYDYKVNTTDKEGNAVTDSLQTVLLVGSKVTKTMGYYTHKYKVLDIDRQEYYDEYQREGMAHVPTIFVSLADKTMDVQEDVPPYHYAYQESEELKWTLLDDTLTITGYLCHKAQTTYGGRTWYAYYTEDIPTTAGPWKLKGLPGLIVKTEDAENIFSFEMFELTQQSIAITNPAVADINKTKRDKLVQMRNKLFLDKRYMEDATYYFTDAEHRNGGGEFYGTIEDLKRRTGGVLRLDECTYKINGIAVPKYAKTRTLYQPLELK
ncbi:MAG: GLPGLI family protein [Prevotellaceae bacterium]|nr:GLPGLI family protein [Candidatus Minthosoma equi]